MPYSANPNYAALYDSNQIGVPLRDLAFTLGSLLLPDLWRQLERSLNADMLDYEKRNRLPLDDNQRAALIDSVAAAQCFCLTAGFDAKRLCVGLFDNIGKNRVAISSYTNSSHYLMLSRALLATAPDPARNFIIAHELAHTLNGDTDNHQHRADKKFYKAGKFGDKPYTEWMQVRTRLQRTELAADARAMELFPTIEEGLNALTEGMLYLQETMHDGRGQYRASNHYSMHPSHIARIRHAERYVENQLGRKIQRHRVLDNAHTLNEAPLITEPDRLKRHMAFDENGQDICKFIAEIAEIAGPRARFVRFRVDPSLEKETRTLAAMSITDFGEDLDRVNYRLEAIRIAPRMLKQYLATIKLIIAHEFGHLLNGDFENPHILSALQQVGGLSKGDSAAGTWELDDPDKLQSYKTLQRAEYAADRRGLSLFKNPIEAAGAMAASAVFLQQTSPEYSRLSLHPSPRARLRVAQRYLNEVCRSPIPK